MKPPYIPKCKKVTNKFEGQMLSFEKDVNLIIISLL